METIAKARKVGKSGRARARDGRRGVAGEDTGGGEDPHFLYCAHDPYPRVEPGEYELYCIEAKPYRDPGLKVWKCRYRFINPMQEGFPSLYGFIHLGDGSKPPGSRSRYLREWTIANGEPGRKRQRLSPRIFTSKLFRVRVDWVLPRQHDGKTHTAASRYSLVKEIIALVCSGEANVPSIEAHKLPSKDG